MTSGTSFPESPSEGELFYRTDEHKWYQYNGSEWICLVSEKLTPVTFVLYQEKKDHGASPLKPDPADQETNYYTSWKWFEAAWNLNDHFTLIQGHCYRITYSAWIHGSGGTYCYSNLTKDGDSWISAIYT